MLSNSLICEIIRAHYFVKIGSNEAWRGFLQLSLFALRLLSLLLICIWNNDIKLWMRGEGILLVGNCMAIMIAHDEDVRNQHKRRNPHNE